MGGWTQGLSSILGSLAPIGGALAGQFLGGQGGASMGANLGSAVGNIISTVGGNTPSSQMQPYQGMSSLMGHAGQQLQGYANPYLGQFGGTQLGQMGSALGQAGGNLINNQLSRYLPQQIGQSSLSNLGQNTGSYLGGLVESRLPSQFQGLGSALGQIGGTLLDRFASPYTSRLSPYMGQMNQLGTNLGGLAGHYIDQQTNRYLPSQLSSSPLNQFGQNLGQFGGTQFDQHMQRYGSSPYGGGQSRPAFGTGGAVLGGLLGMPFLGPLGAAGGAMLGNMLPFAHGGHVHEPAEIRNFSDVVKLLQEIYH